MSFGSGTALIDSMYLRGFAQKSNPTHGSGWMLKILSTVSYMYEGLKSHQRELVDGSDPAFVT